MAVQSWVSMKVFCPPRGSYKPTGPFVDVRLQIVRWGCANTFEKHQNEGMNIHLPPGNFTLLWEIDNLCDLPI